MVIINICLSKAMSFSVGLTCWDKWTGIHLYFYIGGSLLPTFFLFFFLKKAIEILSQFVKNIMIFLLDFKFLQSFVVI